MLLLLRETWLVMLIAMPRHRVLVGGGDTDGGGGVPANLSEHKSIM
jgi:hypothetical protein